MSFDQSFYPTVPWPPLSECAHRLYETRRLFHEGAVDRKGADTRLETYLRHPNARLRRLVVQVAEEIHGAPRNAAHDAPVVEVFAR